MSLRIRSLICFTRSGVPVAMALTLRKREARTMALTRSAAAPCWSMLRSPPSRTTISAWRLSGNTPRSDGRTAPVESWMRNSTKAGLSSE